MQKKKHIEDLPYRCSRSYFLPIDTVVYVTKMAIVEMARLGRRNWERSGTMERDLEPPWECHVKDCGFIILRPRFSYLVLENHLWREHRSSISVALAGRGSLSKGLWYRYRNVWRILCCVNYLKTSIGFSMCARFRCSRKMAVVLLIFVLQVSGLIVLLLDSFPVFLVM